MFEQRDGGSVRKLSEADLDKGESVEVWALDLNEEVQEFTSGVVSDSDGNIVHNALSDGKILRVIRHPVEYDVNLIAVDNRDDVEAFPNGMITSDGQVTFNAQQQDGKVIRILRPKKVAA